MILEIKSLPWLVATLKWFLEHYHGEVSFPATLVQNTTTWKEHFQWYQDETGEQEINSYLIKRK